MNDDKQQQLAMANWLKRQSKDKLRRLGVLPPLGPKDFTKRAKRMLRSFLTLGEVIAYDSIRKEAEKKGIPWENIIEARGKLNIVNVKKGFPAKVVGWRREGK